MRTLGLRRARSREEAALEPELRADARAPTAPASTRRPRPAGRCRPSSSSCASGSSRGGPPTSLTLTKLLALRPLDQLGARAAARRDGPRARARAGRAARPGLPAGNPVVLDAREAVDAATALGAGRADRRAAGARSAWRVEATGSNNWAVSPQRSATGGPLLAGDPHLPPEHARDHLPGRALGRRPVLPRRLASRPPGRDRIGQNNDVAWSFTNAMADVMDLFIERIDGDTLRVRGRAAAAGADRGGDRGQAGAPSPSGSIVRETHHGPIVNEALRADDAEPLALRWIGARRSRASPRPASAVLDVAQRRRSWSRRWRRTTPRSRTWSGPTATARSATRLSAGSRSARGGCPDLPEARLDRRARVGGLGPLRGAARAGRPGVGATSSPPTTGSPPRTIPHHITSDYLDGYRARRIEELIDGRAPSTTWTSFAAMQTDMLSIPGLETAHRLARLRPRDQRETAAIERLRSWDGRMGPDSIAATIYQAFTLRLRARGGAAAIGDRDLAERWLDRADNGFIDPRHLALALAVAPARALGRRATRSWSAGPWDELALDSLRGALDDLERPLRRRPGGMALGRGPPARVPARARRGQPAAAADLQPPARGRRRPGDGRARSAGTRTTRSRRSGRPAGGWSPTRATRSARAGRRSPASRATRPARTTTTSSHAGRAGETQPMAGEGPWQALTLEPDP